MYRGIMKRLTGYVRKVVRLGLVKRIHWSDPYMLFKFFEIVSLSVDTLITTL